MNGNPQTPQTKEKMSYRALRRRALEFAATYLSDADFDVIWGDEYPFDDDEVTMKAKYAAVESIKRLLR